MTTKKNKEPKFKIGDEVWIVERDLSINNNIMFNLKPNGDDTKWI